MLHYWCKMTIFVNYEEVEKYSTRYQLNFYNKIIITQDEDGGIYVDVMTEEHISGYDRYLKHQRKRG